MAYSVTNIGIGNSTGSSSSFSIAVPVGGVPNGALVFVVIGDASSSTAGAIADAAGNAYTAVFPSGIGAAVNLNGFYCTDAKALTVSQLITYTQHVVSNGSSYGSAIYVTGVGTFDSAVTASFGPHAGQPILLTSGTPSAAGELFIAASGCFHSGGAVTYNEDIANGWALPPNVVNQSFSGGAQHDAVAGGTLTNAGSGTKGFQPTWSSITDSYGYIVGFTASAQSNANFGGSGRLSVNAFPAQFGTSRFLGAGSLTVSGVLQLQGLVEFDGAGNLLITTIQHALISTSLFGSGTLGLNATVTKTGSAVFAGSGSLSAIISPLPVVVFGGTGGLVATAFQAVAGNAVFAGTGSLSALVVSNLVGNAKFLGAGSLTASVVFLNQAQFNGTGGLKADTIQAATANTVRAHLGAVGEFPLGQEQDIFPLFAQIVQFNGTGGMVVSTTQNYNDSALFNGTGRMCTFAQVFLGTTGMTSNVEEAGPGPTNNVVV